MGAIRLSQMNVIAPSDDRGVSANDLLQSLISVFGEILLFSKPLGLRVKTLEVTLVVFNDSNHGREI